MTARLIPRRQFPCPLQATSRPRTPAHPKRAQPQLGAARGPCAGSAGRIRPTFMLRTPPTPLDSPLTEDEGAGSPAGWSAFAETAPRKARPAKDADRRWTVVIPVFNEARFIAAT